VTRRLFCHARRVLRRPQLSIVALACAGCGAAAPAPSRPAQTAHSTSTAAQAKTPAAQAKTSRSHAKPARSVSPPHKPTGRAASVRAPHIVWDPIPFGSIRKAQTVAYTRRHYGSFLKPTWHLVHPHVIVIHYTAASYSSTFSTFANDVPDSELHELPATSAHFVIDTQGTIHQLVSVGTMARHTVGLNWTALGIEHVGYSDAQVLGNSRQMNSSLHLVHWLRCRFHIQIRNVIGHNESLSSPYHHEDVASLRTQTHQDFIHRDMQIYRQRLRALGGC
jgi:N-acetylmuramoyl-L-alanine amidase